MMTEKGVFRRIDDRAALAMTGDQQAVSGLADEVLGASGMPLEMQAQAKARILRAEMDFRIGKHRKIREEDVVSAVNNLADLVAVPEYAHTTKHQVHRLRTALAIAMPHFIGTHPTAADTELPSLSPVEAVHLTALMIQQKLNNPEYQLTSHEWEQRRYEERLKDWQERNTQRDSSKTSKPTWSLQTAAIGERHKEIKKAVVDSLRMKSPSNLISIMNSTLDDLKIERLGEK